MEPDRTFTVEGLDMGDELGLRCAAIQHADGRREQLMGFVVMEGQTVREALEACCPPGGSIIIDHDWVPHYAADGRLTGHVCSRCPAVVGPSFEPIDAKPTAMQESAKKQTSSADRWWGKSVIYGKEDEHATPYMTRYWIGRLRLHIFHRGDQDPDCHDHPWDFWTFPFTSYVEEVALPRRETIYPGKPDMPPRFYKHRQIVRAWRWSFRPATHTHRVLGRWTGRWERPWPGRPVDSEMVESYQSPRRLRIEDEPSFGPGPIVTLVWRSEDKRKWGFLKARDGKWCWVHWKSYVFGGGKSAPCE